MNTKTILTLLGVVLFGAGLVMAISGAAVSGVSPQERWVVNDTAGNVTTEGGNITYVDVDVNSLTDRWAAFYGNVTGGLVLRDNTNVTAAVFEWISWNASAGGVVCASRGGTIQWTTVGAITGALIDADMSFAGTEADAAVNTFDDTDANCDAMNFGGGLLGVASAFADHATGTYWTCAYNVTVASPTVGSVPAYCTNITDGNLNFKAEPVNYEILVPTVFGPAQTTTYFFYAQLN